jgi:flagellum-specific peptidoglycan hydrolase FlgJ
MLRSARRIPSIQTQETHKQPTQLSKTAHVTAQQPQHNKDNSTQPHRKSNQTIRNATTHHTPLIATYKQTKLAQSYDGQTSKFYINSLKKKHQKHSRESKICTCAGRFSTLTLMFIHGLHIKLSHQSLTDGGG